MSSSNYLARLVIHADRELPEPIVLRAEGREAIGKPGELRIEISLPPEDEDAEEPRNPESWLGARAELVIERVLGDGTAEDARRIHGVITAVDEGLENAGAGRNIYAVELSPRFAMLDNVIVQDVYVGSSVPAILRDKLAAEDACRSAPLPRDLLLICPTLFSEIPEGTQEPGTLCEGTWQCRSPSQGTRDCHMRLGDTRRLCTWFVPAAPEEACTGTDGLVVECTEGSVCRPEDEATPSERRCLPAVYDGGPCADYEGCAEGYACAYQTSTASSVCVPERALDEPCWDQPDACGSEAYCPVDRGLCTLLPVNQCPMGGCPTALDLVCR